MLVKEYIMGFNAQKEPLYRKVNTRTRMVRHNSGGDFKHERNTKDFINSEDNRASMHAKVQRGLDYTPLYRFLLSKVGKNWTEVLKEAESRLDKNDYIYYMVAIREEDKSDIVCLNENSYYSGLFVDENNLLQKVNPQAGPEKINYWCTCCTRSFNGVPLPMPKKKDDPAYI